MYFLTTGDFELREYRDNEVQPYKMSARRSKVTVIDGIPPEDAWKPDKPIPAYVVAWLSEFSLFQTKSHDTMLISRAYCEVLHLNRTQFLGLIRQFPILESLLRDYNQKRLEHAMALLGTMESDVGDWVRVRYTNADSPKHGSGLGIVSVVPEAS
jgi:hypothetical protein